MRERVPGKPRGGGLALVSALCFLTAPAADPAIADDAPPITRNDFGQVGLIEMPSARMAPDGQISLNASYFENNQRYNVGFQFFPWMEAIFKYSGLDHYAADYPVYWDRSLSAKIRLWNESDILPAVAVGANDLLGTGVFSGEYIVASKEFGNFDASLGMGWGRLATADPIKNPLCALSNSFCTRSSPNAPQGGEFNVSQYFRGQNIGVFGGLNWRSPIDGLTLQAEYSSDKYVSEHQVGNFSPKNQFNFGATYQVTEGVQLGLSYNYMDPLSPAESRLRWIRSIPVSPPG